MKTTLAIAALTILIVALLLMALRYFQKTRSQGLVSNLEPSLAPAGDNLTVHSSITAPFDAIYWTQMNDWQVMEQADDRRPMFGKIAKGTGSAQRADARRSLQVMHKRWSANDRD